MWVLYLEDVNKRPEVKKKNDMRALSYELKIKVLARTLGTCPNMLLDDSVKRGQIDNLYER